MDEVGRLWTSLADYYIRRNLFEKARDVFEEGITTVVTMRDFSVIFDTYSQFEESMVALKMETMDLSDEEDEDDICLDVVLCKSKSKFEKKIFKGFWLHDDKDVDLRLARLEHLMNRRQELANSVLLRQNPDNVEQWHHRVKLFEGNPTKEILTYTEAVGMIDPMKAVGKPHTLWVAFAKLSETYKDLENARVIFYKAVQVNYKTVDHLASVWAEWAETGLRHKNFKGALKLMRRATAEPSVEVKRRVAADGNEPVQMKIHKSLRLWTFYVDLEESLGTLESTRAVSERILDLRTATPQIIINYTFLLEENKYFEDAFKVYERGVKIFKYPHVKDIWAPADAVKPLYLQYAKLEEDYELAKRAMKEIYIACAAEIFGVPKTREIYEQAIEPGLPDKDVKIMCLKYAELEKSLEEIDHAHGIYVFASQFADPHSDADFWDKWREFDVQHGNEDTFREMLRIKWSVSASYSPTHFILPEYLMQKDQNIDEAKDKLTKAGISEDEMAALERQLLPSANNAIAQDSNRKVGFVNAGVESQADGGLKTTANLEDIELPEESDSEEQVEIAQRDVPSAVFGGLAQKSSRKRDGGEDNGGGDDASGAKVKDDNSRLGALERIKRRKQA
ncbi:hypothetical protein DITRI_Ditri19aG0029600 [Diplodiscus trichospermus]